MARMRNKGKRQKVKGKRRNLLFVILIAFILLPLSFFLAFWFFSPWNGKDPLSVVISSGENLWVLSLRPDERRALQISIPPTAVIEVPGRGKWQARALWEISRLENDPSLPAAAGWNLLEVPIDFTLRLPRWQGRETGWRWSVREFQVIKFFRSLDPSRIKEIDLSNINVSRRVVDPGGAELIEVNPQFLSPKVAEWFRLDGLRQEGLTIAVVNSSSRPGAGALLSGQLEHVGLRVVSVTDGTGEKVLTIKNKRLKKSLSVRKLSGWLDVKPVVADFPERADILIVVK